MHSVKMHIYIYIYIYILIQLTAIKIILSRLKYCLEITTIEPIYVSYIAVFPDVLLFFLTSRML